jgi:hypothetical protein
VDQLYQAGQPVPGPGPLAHGCQAGFIDIHDGDGIKRSGLFVKDGRHPHVPVMKKMVQGLKKPVFRI